MNNSTDHASTFIKRIVISVATFVMFSSNPAMACSCASKGAFIDYANTSAGVIHARVLSYGEKLSHGETLYASMMVEVVAVLAGDLEFDALVLLGDPGFLCREYVDSRNFAIGKEYIIAIHNDESVQPFGGCGEAWLAVNNGFVEGFAITKDGTTRYSMPMRELLEKLANH